MTKPGSRLVRWAAVEAMGRQRGPTVVAVHHHRAAERRGRPIGRVAAARKLLTLVYYGLRAGHVRCLAQAGRGLSRRSQQARSLVVMAPGHGAVAL